MLTLMPAWPEGAALKRPLLAETCRFAHVFQVHFGMAAA